MYVHKREYNSWYAARSRCHNKANPQYKNYGGRGIFMCPEWRADFHAFRRHLGAKPEGLTLDRIDNEKGYQPGNVRWTTQKVNMRNTRANRRVAVGGEVKTIAAWSEETGLHRNVLYRRLKKGLSGYDILRPSGQQIVPRKAKSKFGPVLLTVGGVVKTSAQWTAIRGFSKNTITERLARGWTHEDAVLKPLRRAKTTLDRLLSGG